MPSASGKVHWIGTGLSTGSGLALLCDRADVTVWGRTAEKAAACLERNGLTGRAAVGALEDLDQAVGAGDVVVSMLPATEHPALVRLALSRGAHFACSSYTSDEIAAYAPDAVRADVVVLTEAGLDPGIDHILAHSLVARARAAVGDGPAQAWFTSYCGGVPAEPNDFRYRFSWAPRGVLSALCSPARSIVDGEATVAARPWEATAPHVLGGETFEVYPNRDSLPFLAQYAFPAGWRTREFVRGTLRLDGWRAAWAPVFEVLKTGDGSLIDALAADLAATYPTTAADRDRVVLSVALRVQVDGGADWSGAYLLDMVGTAAKDGGENAMAKTVSVPLALGVADILDGRTPPGLHKALADHADADRWLDALRAQGIDCRLIEP
ncbi:saccharopine dehydrogenase family protein [Hamadaea tsunoensis]|uniref:saccharopine dehydrogenase family protein n=1 Tax=Hamadaea tsunoensis TaxID=53368 RepID=UPI00040AD57F|nr:saccharopine dehydrogenase family protein [Hamadaea tsunoensis]